MKKEHLEHLLRAAGAITHDTQFIVIGSQSIHAKYPDLPDQIVFSAEADLVAKNHRDRTEWLNIIGIDSAFHEEFGYYADPVDEKTAVLPRGWKGRLVNFSSPETNGVTGLCLDPYDLVIAKYVAGREKDTVFNRGLVRLGLLEKERLLKLLRQTAISGERRSAISARIEIDFAGCEPRSTSRRRSK